MNTDDKDLFLQFQKKDDQKAFDQLFRKYYEQLCRFALLIVRDETMAEEVVQETFVQIWENRKNIEIEKSINAYLYAAVRHKSINHYHKAKTRLKHEAIFASETPDDTNEPTKLEDLRLKAIINEAIRLLPEKCGEIFVMARFEGLTHEEIADYLKVSKKTIENQMTIAFQKIRGYVHEHMKNTDDRRRIMIFMFY